MGGGYDERDARDARDERDARIEREREERYARDERDERSIQTRANEIREEMARPDPHNAREEIERRERVDHDMRGTIDHDRERDSGRRPEPTDTRIETRLERDQRRRNDTGIETDSARRIQAPRDLRSSDGSGRRVGHLDEPMIDVPPRFKCNGTSMPSCSSVVTYERTPETPLRTTFEHNVNGPDDFRAEQEEEKKNKKEEAKTKRQEKRKADEETRKQEKKDQRLADKANKKAEAKEKGLRRGRRRRRKEKQEEKE